MNGYEVMTYRELSEEVKRLKSKIRNEPIGADDFNALVLKYIEANTILKEFDDMLKAYREV